MKYCHHSSVNSLIALKSLIRQLVMIFCCESFFFFFLPVKSSLTFGKLSRENVIEHQIVWGVVLFLVLLLLLLFLS